MLTLVIVLNFSHISTKMQSLLPCDLFDFSYISTKMQGLPLAPFFFLAICQPKYNFITFIWIKYVRLPLVILFNISHISTKMQGLPPCDFIKFQQFLFKTIQGLCHISTKCTFKGKRLIVHIFELNVIEVHEAIF